MSDAPHPPASGEADLVGYASDQALESLPSEGDGARAAMHFEALRAAAPERIGPNPVNTKGP